MIVLHGILRQAAPSEWEGKKRTKLWVEYSSPRENGPDDLRLEELFLDGDKMAELPKAGQFVSIVVRPYTSGKAVKFAAVALQPVAQSAASPVKAA